MQLEVRLYFLFIYDNGDYLEVYRAAFGLFNRFRIRCFKFVYSLNHASETLNLFPLLKRKLGQFSFHILLIGYMIVLLQGGYLWITPALDLGFLVKENIYSKLIVVSRLFASAVLALNR